jgi:DNA-binding NarL/FixJ family response regulator
MKKDKLDPRCQAVLVGILKGLSNSEIANKLGHSENHIRMQLYKILEHYELHSRTQLLAEYCLRVCL